MTFEEIVEGVESPIVLAAPLGEVEEFIRCDRCERLVRARPSAIALHEGLTCELYAQALAVTLLEAGL